MSLLSYHHYHQVVLYYMCMKCIWNTLYYYFTAILLLLYCYFTTTLLLFYYYFTAALHVYDCITCIWNVYGIHQICICGNMLVLTAPKFTLFIRGTSHIPGTRHQPHPRVHAIAWHIQFFICKTGSRLKDEESKSVLRVDTLCDCKHVQWSL